MGPAGESDAAPGKNYSGRQKRTQDATEDREGKQMLNVADRIETSLSWARVLWRKNSGRPARACCPRPSRRATPKSGRNPLRDGEIVQPNTWRLLGPVPVNAGFQHAGEIALPAANPNLRMPGQHKDTESKVTVDTRSRLRRIGPSSRALVPAVWELRVLCDCRPQIIFLNVLSARDGADVRSSPTPGRILFRKSRPHS